MAEKVMLILDRGLIEKIDENRGDISRAEFVEFCLDRYLEEAEREEAERREKPAVQREVAAKPEELTGYATSREFKEFKRDVANLLRTFLDFFITFGLELGASKTTENTEQLKLDNH